jgi:GNAT superfamily N-acetyltransferase
MREFYCQDRDIWQTETDIIADIEDYMDTVANNSPKGYFVQKKVFDDCNVYIFINKKYTVALSNLGDYDHVYLRTFYVSPKYRNQGIGGKLLDNIILDCFNNKVERIKVEPFSSVVDYFLNLGFEFNDDKNEVMFLNVNNYVERNPEITIDNLNLRMYQLVLAGEGAKA